MHDRTHISDPGLYDFLNKLDDARERRANAEFGSHEPKSYGGVDVEDLGDAPIERVERNERTERTRLDDAPHHLGCRGFAPTDRRRKAVPRRKRPTGKEYVPCVFRRIGDAHEPVGGIFVPTYA